VHSSLAWFLVFLGGLAAAILIPMALQRIIQRRVPDWLRIVREALVDIQAGQVKDPAFQYGIRYQKGDRSPETILILLLAYAHAGHLHKAAKYAGPARQILEKHTLCQESAGRDICHAVKLALADVEMSQGRFIKAAGELAAYAPESPYPDRVYASAALGYFLGIDKSSARDLLDHIRFYELRTDDKPPSRPTLNYQIIVLYLRHKLLREDTIDKLRELAAAQLESWEERANHAAPTPYGQHLRVLLDDLKDRAYLNLTWHQETLDRLKRGEDDAVIARALAAREQGDTSLVNTLTLALVYIYQGRGDDAEPYARQAREDAARWGLCELGPRYSALYCDMVTTALFDVRVIQGRYAEGGQILADFAAKSTRPNAMHIFAAWAYFMAEDYDRVRELLNQLQRVHQWDTQTNVPPKYQFIALYMGHVVLETDTRAEMRKLAAAQLPKWEEEAARNAGSLYGARLREILDDISQVLEDT
jgi:hypothetical protein